MKFRTKLIALGSLAAGLAASLILGTFFSYRGTERRSAEIPLMSALRTGTMREIAFYGAGGEILLRAGENRDWNIILDGRPFPAERGKVERFIEILDRSLISRPVTERRELWPVFEVQEENTRRIRLSGDAGMAVLILGKDGTDGSGQYIRFTGEDGVLLVSEDFLYYAEQTPAYWSELRLFPRTVEGRNITSLAVRSGSSDPGYRLIRERGSDGVRWAAEGSSARIRQDRADAMAVAVAGAAGTAFAAAPENVDTGLEAPGVEISFTTSDLKTYRILIGRPADAEHWYCAAVEGETRLPYVYLYSSYGLSRMARTLGELTAD